MKRKATVIVHDLIHVSTINPTLSTTADAIHEKLFYGYSVKGDEIKPSIELLVAEAKKNMEHIPYCAKKWFPSSHYWVNGCKPDLSVVMAEIEPGVQVNIEYQL